MKPGPLPTRVLAASATMMRPVLLLAALAAAVARAQFVNFGQTCSAISLVGTGAAEELEATCRNTSGGDNGAQVIPLSTCLTNNGGHLACQVKCVLRVFSSPATDIRVFRSGNAMNSCSTCSLAGTVLTCSCSPVSGNPVATSLDLSEQPVFTLSGRLLTHLRRFLYREYQRSLVLLTRTQPEFRFLASRASACCSLLQHELHCSAVSVARYPKVSKRGTLLAGKVQGSTRRCAFNAQARAHSARLRGLGSTFCDTQNLGPRHACYGPT